MSDENVGGLVELPPLPDIGPEGWYTRADMIAYARAALSAHGQPVVDGDVIERVKEAILSVREWSLQDKDDYLRRIAIAAATAALEGATT